MHRSSSGVSARLIAAFLLIWLPYVAAVGLQERFAVEGPLGPALMALALLLAWPAGIWLSREERANPFGLRLDRWTVPLLVGGVALMLLLRAAMGSIGTQFGWMGGAGSSADAAAIASILAIGFVPALAEDILTRGFPLFAARLSWRPIAVIALSALLYTLNHFWRFDWGITEQLRLFAMGLAYAAAAWRTGSLWAAVGLHVGWNAGGAIGFEILAVDEVRMLTAGLHLLLFAAIMLWPRQPYRTASTS